jgi:hypothetical protein
MRNIQRPLIVILLTLGAFSLLCSQVGWQAAGIPSALTMTTTTATVTSTITTPLVIQTKLSLIPSANPIRRNQTFTVKLTLLGSNQGRNASIPNQQVSVTPSWGASVECLTQNDGACQVSLKAPTNAGNYLITVKYAGNVFFSPSTATTNLRVQ